MDKEKITLILLGIVSLIYICLFVRVIIIFTKNKKYQNQLKVGDVTGDGIILSIDGDAITVQKIIPRNRISKPSY